MGLGPRALVADLNEVVERRIGIRTDVERDELSIDHVGSDAVVGQILHLLCEGRKTTASRSRVTKKELRADVDLGCAARVVRQQVCDAESVVVVEANSVVLGRT